MSTKGVAYVMGAYEHPTRKATDKSIAQLHAEVAKGALEDAGLTKDDVDGYFCASDAPGHGPLNMVDYMNLNVRHVASPYPYVIFSKWSPSELMWKYDARALRLTL